MRKIFLFLLIFCYLCCCKTSEVAADEFLLQEIKAMKAQMQVMQGRVDILEEKVDQQAQDLSIQQAKKEAYQKRIEELEEQLAQQPAALQGSPVKAKWTPDIGVIADMVYTQNSAKEDAEGADRLSVREMEIVFGSEVDPYSRLDATVSFSDFEDPSLEEAYLTRFGLPWEMTGRIGKFKPKVGKALPVHRDSLDTVDEPLVIQKYFGVEGLNKSGLDLIKDIDLSWPVVHQLSFGILEGGNGEEGTAFGETRRRPTLYSHLKNYVDVSNETGLELGLSHMAGSRDEDSRFEVQVLGADVTLKHDFNANQNMKLQGEVFNLSRKETEEFDGNLWGAYGLMDFRVDPLWSAGYRYDYVQPVDNDRSENPQKEDLGHTGYLTFYQSEFARWRAQFTHKELITGKDDNTFMLQGTFAIGDHKHKLQ